MKPITPERCTYGDPEAVAQGAAERILQHAERAIRARGRFRLVLAGGTTPLSTYGRLAAARSAWSAWEIYYGDERCVPANDPQRNSRAAAEVWLDRVGLGAASRHPIPAELGAEPAATAYGSLVAQAMPFDLVLLGMGEDGHTASLFPGRTIPDDRLVIPVRNAPKPPPDRVSLTPAAFAGAGEILILVTGAGKRRALQAWYAGADLPIAYAAMASRSLVLVDAAAAGDHRR